MEKIKLDPDTVKVANKYETTPFKLNTSQLDNLQTITTPLNVPVFKELREKYETFRNQAIIFKLEVEKMRKPCTSTSLKSTIEEVEEALEALKRKGEKLERDLKTLANKQSDIHHKLPMPIAFGTTGAP